MFSDEEPQSRVPFFGKTPHASSLAGARSGLAPATGEPKVHRLAHLFATEPELILACLEFGEGDQPPELGTILAAAQQATIHCPDYADLHYFAARAATRAGKLETALDLLARALHLNPQYNDALILAARVSMAQGQQDEAIAYLRQALSNGANYADVHLTLGDLWQDRQKVLPARQAYQRALDLNSSLGAARDGLAALKPTSENGGTDELPA